MRKEYDLEKLKVKRRGMLPNLTEEDAVPSKSKIRVTMLLDQDVLAYFKAKAQESGALPYQTQINQALRRVMEAETDNTSALKSALLKDADFIRAVAREAKKLEPA